MTPKQCPNRKCRARLVEGVKGDQVGAVEGVIRSEGRSVNATDGVPESNLPGASAIDNSGKTSRESGKVMSGARDRAVRGAKQGSGSGQNLKPSEALRAMRERAERD